LFEIKVVDLNNEVHVVYSTALTYDDQLLLISMDLSSVQIWCDILLERYG